MHERVVQRKLGCFKQSWEMQRGDAVEMRSNQDGIEMEDAASSERQRDQCRWL